MLEQLDNLVPWVPHPEWVIPAVGGAITGLAFFVGRSFLSSRPATQPELLTGASEQALLGVVSDRRAAPRRSGNVVEVSLWDGGEAPHLHATVQDRSVGGLRLFLDTRIPEGSVFKVRPRYAPISTPWTTIIVKRCRAEGGKWEARCQFQQSPSYNVLLLFG